MMHSQEDIIKWMRGRIETGQFTDAALLAREFLTEHDVHDVLDPTFQKVMDAGFELAGEIARIDK